MIRMMLLSGVFAGLIVSAACADTPAAPAAPAAPVTPAATSTPAAETRIAFANHGGIYNWQVLDDRTVLIQGQNRKWYKATLMSSCFDLPFAERIGIESNADGSFDKFSSIEVRGRSCPLISLVDSAAPPRKVKATKKAAVPSAAAPTAPTAPTAPEAPAAPAAPASPAR